MPGSFCCGVRWSEAGRFYLLIGGILCVAGVLALLATGLGHHGPMWIGPIISGAGLVLIGKGVFDYVRHRVKASADRPAEPVESVDSVDGHAVVDGANRQRRRMRLLSALPFGAASARRRRQKHLAANLRYLQGAAASSGTARTESWAAGYGQQEGTLRPPPRELVQNASLLLAGTNSSAMKPGGASNLAAASLISSDAASSFGYREPVYFPVMSSTSRLPTPQESPFPSVFSLQDNPGAAVSSGAVGARLLSARRNSGVSAPSLFDTLRPASSLTASRRPSRDVGGGGVGGVGAAVVGRSRGRLPLLPSQAANRSRLASHKEEV